MKKILFILSFLLSASLQAEGQFYLLAKPGVMGGPSQSGQTGLGVYLRWDVLEGAIPDDVATLRLERDGQEIGAWTPDSLMSETEISTIYQGVEQQQRLLQTLTLLKEIQLAEIPPVDFEPDQYASVLRDRLLNVDNSFWTFLASRLDFNIARVRHRAYLDTDVQPATSYTYTLYAVQTDPPQIGTAAEVIIGQAQIDIGNAHQLLPVRELKQLVENSCDSSMDHYTVALDWLPPGVSVTDQTANNLQLAGYELYRSTENIAPDVSDPPPRNLATEAASLPHDGRGEIVFPGLQRVNRQLLTLDGDNDPASPEFIEAQDKLGLAGLKPGDRRAYYVVGRDFSGHYGETAAVMVQIPNRLSPKAPWDIATGVRRGNQSGILVSWDAVDLAAFQAEYPRRVICNPTEAADSGLVEYADSAEACADPAIARVDVSGYRLYRFNTALEARGFRDSDGDGISDKDESEEGLQCNPNQQPAGATDYRVPPLIPFTEQTTTEGTRLSFLDPGAQLVEGEYYYYRLASYTADGKFSTARGPYRELYPDMTPPALPTYEIVRQTSTGCCTVVEVDASQKEWSFTSDFTGYSTLSLVNSERQTDPLEISEFGSAVSALCQDETAGISDFWGPASGRSLLYPGQYPETSDTVTDTPPIYCAADFPATMDLCKSGAWQLHVSQCETQEPVTEGDFGSGPVTFTGHTSDGDTCLEYYEMIAGQRRLMGTSCGTDTPELLVVEFDGGLACGNLVARDSSNNTSEPAEIPCNRIQTDRTPPSPPQVISLNAFSDHLDFSWRSPLKPTSATLIEITSDLGDEDTQLLSFPANNQEPGLEFDGSTLIHTLVGARDMWCIRAMAVGLAAEGQRAQRSAWSGKLCKVRRENGLNETEYLPWPTIQPLDAGPPLVVELAADYVSDLQGEDPEDLPILIHYSAFNNLFLETDSGGVGLCFGYQEINPLNPERHHLLAEDFACLDSGRHLIDSRIETPFMVYRQARSPQGDTGPWVQVSPLIESIHWKKSLDKDSLTPINTLSDPYFAMYRYEYSELQNGVPWHLGFVDRYPYILGYEYRYQTLTFTPEHAINAWRLSDWVLATSPVTE